MLSLNQFLRLISLPAVVVAFTVASHIAVALNATRAPAQLVAKNSGS